MSIAMEEEEDDKRVVSILQGRKGYMEEYPEISEFKKHLKEADLKEYELGCGWVLCEQNSRNTTQVKDKIIRILKTLIHTQSIRFHCLVQFWAVVEVEGGSDYLSTSHQPFCVSHLKKGLCWYRNRSTNYVYDDEEGGEERRGGVGRAYLNKRSESTPDLRLYSAHEFPMRDLAARCGFTGYLALPLFGLHNNKCYGVLELLSCFTIMETFLLSSLGRELQMEELRSTHFNFISQNRYSTKMPKSEIGVMLELAMETVPQLYLAQVWVPCKECASNSINLLCMERESFINYQSKTLNSCGDDTDKDMSAYIKACEFHNRHMIDIGCFHQNSCDFSISKNPLAHYAARARLSVGFTVHLKNVHDNKSCVIEFFHQPNCREDACGSDSFVHLLLRIVEAKLENFEFSSRGQLPKQFLQPTPIQPIDMWKMMSSQKETFSEAGFIEYLQLQMVELCGLRLSFQGSERGWVFCMPTTKDIESLLAVKKKIQVFLKTIAVTFRTDCCCMVQFWAPQKVGDRCCLETLYQPFALGCLAKGLASFRKECMTHYYCVDEDAKEEELGPPGRVFKNGHPEISPDLSLYTTQEFFIRNHAVHCGFQAYFALPVFDDDDDDKHKCVGVLEFIGFSDFELYRIQDALKKAKLSSTHINALPRFLANEKAADINGCPRTEALTEVREAFQMISKIPQLHQANVWVPYEECVIGASTNLSCMELALSSESLSQFMPTDQVHWFHVQPRKGIIGMVLESESKSCFCRNLSEFSIADQPLAHYERRERHDVCFAICLQSSRTGDLLYVVEFYLYQGPATYEYLSTFLNFLFPILKQKLKSFKMASGEQLGKEIEVEVIEFSEANKVTSYASASASASRNVSPLKFKSVHYGHKEHRYDVAEETQVQLLPYVTQTQGKVISSACVDFKKPKGGKRKIHPQLSREVLEKHFHMKIKDVAKELSVGVSTIKRTCRSYGIHRWPYKAKHVEREGPEQDLQPSSSTKLHHTNKESTEHVVFQEEGEKMIVKVQHEEDTIKFEVCLSVGVDKLREKVAMKLNLQLPTVKLKYMDEDGEKISLTCDEDLELCPKSQTETGKTFMRLFVELRSI